ncbi:MAG: hypothetical protein NTZ51_11710 [Proteobacteria bacterium]|nr:hypothetical protein [Pseudomonadota bacterium]
MAYFLFSLLLILIGAYSISAQIYFIRELLVLFFGNELCIGVIFSCWFAGIAAGAVFSGRLTKKVQYIWTAFSLSLIILTISPFIVLPVMRILRGLLAVPPGECIPLGKMVLGAFITVFPFSFVIGFIFPVACKAATFQDKKAAISIGWVYVWESIGSLAGGSIISLVLIPDYRPLQVFGSIACMIWAVCWCAIANRNEGRWLRGMKVILPLLSGCMLFILAAGLVNRMEDYSIKKRWETFNTQLRLIGSQDSWYQNNILAEGGGQYSIFSNGQLCGNYPDEYQSAFKAHLFLCEHSDPKSVLLIGDGLTGIMKEILQHPVKTVDYLEIDSKLLNLIRPVLAAQDLRVLEDKRVRIIFTDGRRYVKKCKKRYDIVVINTPEPSTAALNRFYTVDFFKEVKGVLSENGFMVIGISSSPNYVGKEVSEYAGSLYKGLQTIFPFVLVTPGDKNYFFAGAKPDLFTADYNVLSRRYRDRNIHTASFSPELFKGLFQKERVAFIKHALSGTQEVILNTDDQPVTYFYNLLLWEIVTAGKENLNLFQHMKGRVVWWLLLLLAIFCFARIRTMARVKAKGGIFFNCLWAIGTTGFTGMALELVLIFYFQNMYGYIYQMIGIIVALFMLGLALGGYWMKQQIKHDNKCTIETLIIFELILCMYAATIPFIITGLRLMQDSNWIPGVTAGSIDVTGYIYFFIVLGAGFLTGVEFPLVSHVLIDNGYNSSSMAGWVNSIDHLGACIGSILTGTILMPLAGIYTTCLLVSMLNITSIIFLTMEKTIYSRTY